jgi:hypothetical protein
MPMQDSFDRITSCLHVLSSPNPEVTQCWLEQCRTSYSALLSEKQSRLLEEQQAKAAELLCQPDDLINFAHLKHRKGLSQVPHTLLPCHAHVRVVSLGA